MTSIYTTPNDDQPLNEPVKLFAEIPGSSVILYSRGTYTQAELYTRGQYVYAGQGSKFIRLLTGGVTSSPSVRWVEMDGGRSLTLKREHGSILVG